MKYTFLVFLFFWPMAALASLQYQTNVGFVNVNFLFNRNEFPINDYETFKADFKLDYNNDKDIKVVFWPRVKIDFLDFSRNRYLPHETYVTYYRPHYEFSAGLKKTSQGVSNSYNPTDIVNRKDFEDNFFDPEKLGEATLSSKWMVDKVGPFREFTIETTAFPFFQKTPLPELDTRFALQNKTGGIPYSVTDYQDTPAYPEAIGGALTLAGTVDPVDMKLHYYHGPSHDPGYTLVIDNNGSLRMEPFYFIMDMIGFNLEAPVGDFLLHLETALKLTGVNDPRSHDIPFEENNAMPRSNFEFVPGFDYTFHNFAGKGDLKVTFEFLGAWNRRQDLRYFNPFQNDVFFGFRYDWLNTRDTRLEFGVAKDLGNRETIVTTHIESKLVKELKLKVGGTFVKRDEAVGNSPLTFFRNNSFVYAELSYAFGGRIDGRGK